MWMRPWTVFNSRLIAFIHWHQNLMPGYEVVSFLSWSFSETVMTPSLISSACLLVAYAFQTAGMWLIRRIKGTVRFCCILLIVIYVCRKTQGSSRVQHLWRDFVSCLCLVTSYCHLRCVLVIIHFILQNGAPVNLFLTNLATATEKTRRSIGQVAISFAMCDSTRHFKTALFISFWKAVIYGSLANDLFTTVQITVATMMPGIDSVAGAASPKSRKMVFSTRSRILVIRSHTLSSNQPD